MKKLTVGIIAAVSVAVNFLTPKIALGNTGVSSCIRGQHQLCQNESVRNYIYRSNINWNPWQKLSVDERLTYGVAICAWMVRDRISFEDVSYWIAGALGYHGDIATSSQVIGATYEHLCPAITSDPSLYAAYNSIPSYQEVPDAGAYGRSQLEMVKELLEIVNDLPLAPEF